MASNEQIQSWLSHSIAVLGGMVAGVVGISILRSQQKIALPSTPATPVQKFVVFRSDSPGHLYVYGAPPATTLLWIDDPMRIHLLGRLKEYKRSLDVYEISVGDSRIFLRPFGQFQAPEQVGGLYEPIRESGQVLLGGETTPLLEVCMKIIAEGKASMISLEIYQEDGGS